MGVILGKSLVTDPVGDLPEEAAGEGGLGEQNAGKGQSFKEGKCLLESEQELEELRNVIRVRANAEAPEKGHGGLFRAFFSEPELTELVVRRGGVDVGKGLAGFFRIPDVDLEKSKQEPGVRTVGGKGECPADEGKGRQGLSGHLVGLGHEKAKFERFALLFHQEPIGVEGPSKLVHIRGKPGHMPEKSEISGGFSELLPEKL
jgi:hypothetical protein